MMSMPCVAASTTLASILASVRFLSPQTGAKFAHPTVTTFSNAAYSGGIIELPMGHLTRFTSSQVHGFTGS